MSFAHVIARGYLWLVFRLFDGLHVCLVGCLFVCLRVCVCVCLYAFVVVFDKFIEIVCGCVLSIVVVGFVVCMVVCGGVVVCSLNNMYACI